MAKVLIVNSSARKKSNSAILSERVARGAAEKGHTVETVELGALDIRPCRGCDACLAPNSKGCVVRDDMQPLYPKVRDADVLVFSSPIYWFNLCGQIKQFIDRLYAIAANPDAEGKSILASKKIGAVLVYGDVDPFASGCVNAIRSLQDICSYSGAEWASALYGSAYEQGEALENEELLAKAKEYGAGL